MRLSVVATCIACACIAADAAPAQPADKAGASLVLVNGTIYADPQAKPIENGVVLVEKGVIVAVGRRGSVKIPKGVQVIDCARGTIAAGFWNSHVHFLQRKWSDAASIPAEDLTGQLQQMLTMYGFTSVFDTWSNFPNTRKLRERIESGEVLGPRIRTTGEALMPKKGMPPAYGFGLLGFGPVTIQGVENGADAQAIAAKLLDSGTDGVKIYAETFAPRVAMAEEAVQAAIAEAHRHDKLAFAHPTSNEAMLTAVRHGVDVIVHTAANSPVWDQTLLTAMKERGVALVPTLKLWRHELRHDRLSVQQQRTERAVEQLRAWVGAGGTVLFGTDVGYIDDYTTADEFALMGRAGMDHRQILESLTTAPARKFGEAARLGRVATGYLADLVVMQADPARDVGAFAAIGYAIRDGHVIYEKKR